MLRDATAGLIGEAPHGLSGGVEVVAENVRAGSGGCWVGLGELDLLGTLGGSGGGVAANTSL